jgi:ADP-ribose pyrophosphatase YjhB (NUDIX family)
MLHRGAIRHCKACGAAVQYRLPDDGDTRERAVCPACHVVHYENPLNVVGTLPFIDERVLLCLRNIEPRKGKWTLPAGFMELGETVAEGALRETQEEAGAQIEMLDLFTLMNVVRVGQVHFFFRARLLTSHSEPCAKPCAAISQTVPDSSSNCIKSTSPEVCQAVERISFAMCARQFITPFPSHSRIS